MSNRNRSNRNARRSHHQYDTATRKQAEARKHQKARKQRMPAQNKVIILIALAILCVGLVAPELLALLGAKVAVVVKWVAIIAIILAIVATRYKMTVSDCIGWLIDKILNRDDDYEDDDEWDDDEEWDDFDDDDDFVEEVPQPAVRRRAPAPVSAPVVEGAQAIECNKEDYEMFLKFMEFQNAQKKAAQTPKAEPAPKTSKKS